MKELTCPTSRKEVEFYSPLASDIATQWYSSYDE